MVARALAARVLASADARALNAPWLQFYGVRSPVALYPDSDVRRCVRLPSAPSPGVDDRQSPAIPFPPAHGVRSPNAPSLRVHGVRSPVALSPHAHDIQSQFSPKLAL